MNLTIQLLQNHRSIRAFTNEPVTDEELTEILKSSQMASTSGYIQAYSVIRVTDPQVRKQLAVIANRQSFVEESPVFLVWCADLYRHQAVCEKQGTAMRSENVENFLVAAVDTALAAQNAAVAAESLGLGFVYVGAIRNNPAEVSRLLGLPKLVIPIFGMCLGRPDQSPALRPRLPLELVVHENTYDAGKQSNLEAYDEVVRQYYHELTEGRKDTDWSKEMAAKFSRASRPFLKSFFSDQGFPLE